MEYFLLLLFFFEKANGLTRLLVLEKKKPVVIEQKMAYIHWNPVNAKIVEQLSHYVYSSASNYLIGNGILVVEVIPPMSEIEYVKP